MRGEKEKEGTLTVLNSGAKTLSWKGYVYALSGISLLSFFLEYLMALSKVTNVECTVFMALDLSASFKPGDQALALIILWLGYIAPHVH